MSKRNLPGNWSSIKKEWKQKNPPDEHGYYTCWICKQPVHISTVTLDHVFPAGQYPELAHRLDNLEPAHGVCNQVRGGSILIKKYGHSYRGSNHKRRR